MDVQLSVAKWNSSNILRQSVLTSLIGFTVNAHLRGVRQSMSNTPCLPLSLCSSSCALGGKPDFKTPPHQVLDPSAQTHINTHTSRTEQFSKWQYSVCVREREREGPYVFVDPLSHSERGRAVKVPPPHRLGSTSSISLCLGILRMQRWLWQHCRSERRRGNFFLLFCLSLYLQFFLFVSLRQCHGVCIQMLSL